MRRHLKLLLALAMPVALLAAGCGDDDDGGTAATDGDDVEVPDGPAIRIGAQDFGESAILAEIYGQALADAGYEVEQVSVGGFRDLLLGSFEGGDVNLSPEYAASMLEFMNDQAGEATSDAAETVEILQGYLDDRGLVALEPSDAVDTNAFVVTRDTADRLGLESLSDLAEVDEELTLGAPQDCETNPFCIPGLERVYGVDLSGDYVPLDPGLVATALTEGEIDVALLFSTDGRIAENDWVLLEDDQDMLAADNVTPVLSDELVEAYGDDLAELLDRVSAALTTEDLIEMNRRYDIDREDASDIASDWISDNL